MLTPDEILTLIVGGESQTLEFKSSFQKEVMETISAFANTNGGKIMIGVDDKGEIFGTDAQQSNIPDMINSIKQNTSPSIIPDVDLYKVQNKNILIINVDEFPVKPVAYRGRFFKRFQNSNHLMSSNEIANVHLKSVNSSWDYYPDPNHNIQDISSEKIKEFMNMAEINDSVENVKKKFEFVKKDQITFGAYLLFTKNENAITTTIETGRFSDEISIKDAITIQGDLFSEVEAVMDFVKKHINKAYIITGAPKREERWDYPLDAIREIVINMVVYPVKYCS